MKKSPFNQAEDLLAETPPPADLIDQLEALQKQVKDPELRRLFGQFFEAAEAML